MAGRCKLWLLLVLLSECHVSSIASEVQSNLQLTLGDGHPPGLGPPPPQQHDGQPPPSQNAELQLKAKKLLSKLNSEALWKLKEFSPVTPEGRRRAQFLASALGRLPGLGSYIESTASNPAAVIRVLNYLRGSPALLATYSYLGGETEVHAHQKLMQTVAMTREESADTKKQEAAVKAAFLYTVANSMLFILLLSETYEYMFFEKFWPGAPFPDDGGDEKDKGKKDNEDERDKTEGDSMMDQTMATLDGAVGPAVDTFKYWAWLGHNLVTYGGNCDHWNIGIGCQWKMVFIWFVFMTGLVTQMWLYKVGNYVLSDTFTDFEDNVKVREAGYRVDLPHDDADNAPTQANALHLVQRV